MAETGKKWYVLRAVSGKEAKVKEYIDAELKHNKLLQQYVSQVLIPMEKRCVMASVWSRRRFLSLAMYLLKRSWSVMWLTHCDLCQMFWASLVDWITRRPCVRLT